MKIYSAVILGFLASIVVVFHFRASHYFATMPYQMEQREILPLPAEHAGFPYNPLSTSRWGGGGPNERESSAEAHHLPTNIEQEKMQRGVEDAKFEPILRAPHSHCSEHYTNGDWSDNVTWTPRNVPSRGCPPFRHFSQDGALECLQDMKILLIGNSNTRALYTAMEAVLRNQGVRSRLEAKQLCDNSKYNHSCWQTIKLKGKSVHMHYWGYIQDLYHPELDKKTQDQKDYDIILMNSGVNVIQAQPEERWSREHRNNIPKLHMFAKSFKKGSKFIWHSTTRLCESQPHFRRYRYQPKFWRQRKLQEMNAEIDRSNAFLRKNLIKDVVAFVDGAGMVDYTHGKKICPWYDDPLHHKFLDLKLVDVILNIIC